MIDIDPSKHRQLSPSYGDKSFTGLSDTGESLANYISKALTYDVSASEWIKRDKVADEFVSY
jgi:hypothetical protein